MYWCPQSVVKISVEEWRSAELKKFDVELQTACSTMFRWQGNNGSGGGRPGYRSARNFRVMAGDSEAALRSEEKGGFVPTLIPNPVSFPGNVTFFSRNPKRVSPLYLEFRPFLVLLLTSLC